METAIKTLETSLAEKNATIRILQSKNSASNLAVNNLDELLAAKMTSAPPSIPPSAQHAAQQLAATPHDNVLNIPILNSSSNPHSPHKKFTMPSVLATPPQYHSLNLSKKLGHTHRSLTPSADMFLKGSAPPPEFIRSATPSADILRAAPSEMLRATPSNQLANELLRATPTSAELHRLSAPADMLRATPTSIEMLRATPTSAELLKADLLSRGTPPVASAAAMAEMLRSSATPSSNDHLVDPASLKRREPSGTSTGDFQHPGPT